MKEFVVYFELFNKKMKTTVAASTEDEAKSIVANKIIFHKIEQVNNQPIIDSYNLINDIFEAFKK